MIPQIIARNQTWRDVKEVYSDVNEENTNEINQHFPGKTIESTIYGPAENIAGLEVVNPADDFYDLTKIKPQVPYNRITTSTLKGISFGTTQMIPGDISILYVAWIYDVLKNVYRVPKVINYQSRPAQLIEVKIPLQLQHGINIKERVQFINEDYGYELMALNYTNQTCIVNTFRAYNRIVQGLPFTYTRKPFVQPPKHDAKYFINLLEENRKRILAVLKLDNESNFRRMSDELLNLIAYDIVFQQVNLIISLIRRNLIGPNDRPTLEQLHHIFIANIDSENYFIEPPISLYMGNYEYVHGYWRTLLESPNIMFSIPLAYPLFQKNFPGSRIFEFSNIRIYEAHLVPDPNKVYDKHPTDIENLQWEGYRLDYIYPIRDPYNRGKDIDNWNLQLVDDTSYLKDKKWSFYFENSEGLDGAPEYLGEYNTFDEVYDAIQKQLIRERDSVPGSVITKLDEVYNKEREYDLKDNELIAFKVEPRLKGAIVFAIGERQNLWYALKGTWEDQDSIPVIFQELEYEEELKVPFSSYRLVTVNGITFDSRDLRLFYNTFLFDTITATGEQTLELPNLSLRDLKLLRDMLKGRLSFLYFYQNISQYGYAQLSSKRTMLDLYDLKWARYYIDKAFKIGLPFRQQLASIQVAKTLGKIGRLEELVRIASE